MAKKSPAPAPAPVSLKGGQRGGGKKDSMRSTREYHAEETAKSESKARPVSDFPDLEDALPSLAERSRELAQIIASAEAERKELNDYIKQMMIDAGADSVYGDDWMVIKSNGRSASKIDPKLLLANGVKMDVIERSTVPGDSYQYVQIKERKVR